jgi:D-2-hydroxyglutarate dehydrogenase
LKIEQDDLDFFTSTLGKQGVITDEDRVKRYNTDWIGKYTGKGSLVLSPKDTTELSNVMVYCNKRMYDDIS